MRKLKAISVGLLLGASGLCAVAACVGDDPVVATNEQDASTTDGSSSGDSQVGDEGTATCGDTTSSAANCGSCGHACATGYSCAASVCGNVAVAIIAGGAHTCVALSKSDVWCWGENGLGEIGNGATSDAGVAPTLIAHDYLGGTVSAVAFGSGFAHTCLIKSDKTVQCWGDDTFGELGDQIASGPTPIVIDAPKIVTTLNSSHTPLLYPQIAHGSTNSHTCALDSAGLVDCWGSDEFKQVTGAGDGGTDIMSCGGDNCQVGAYQPFSVPVKQASVGAVSSCALLGDGGVICWGDNHDGELGEGDRATAVHSAFSLIPHAATFIESAGSSTCAILDPDGSVWCWGGNNSDQLGHDQNSTDAGDGCCSTGGGVCTLTQSACNPTPIQVAGLTGATMLTMGNAHTCALKSDHTVVCWGSNANGQLGAGDNTSSFAPRAVQGISDAIAITAGTRHTCALHKDGTVSCWGANDQLQLGSGVPDSNVPVVITGLPH